MLIDIIVSNVSRRALNGTREKLYFHKKRRTVSIIRNIWQEKGMESVSQQGWKEERSQSTWTEIH